VTGRLLVVGSINHDMVVTLESLPRPGETVLGADLVERDGGKGANAAAAAAQLGATVSMVGAVGTDPRGERAIAVLEAAGVDVSWVERLPEHATGVAIVAVDDAGENQIVVAPGANARLTAAHVERALGQEADAVLVSCEIPDDAVAAAVRGAGARGLPCILNPAPARAAVLELARHTAILTPNRTEAAQLTGRDDPDGAASALAARTGAPVIVTLGERGALLRVPGRATRKYPAPTVPVVDTTGAGDAFNGALGAGLALGHELEAAVANAVAAAARSVETLGARAPLTRS
jgi:ribokinase